MRRLVWVGEIESRITEQLAEKGYEPQKFSESPDWETPPPIFVVNCHDKSQAKENMFGLAQNVRKQLPGATGILVAGELPPVEIAEYINEIGIFRVAFQLEDFPALLQQIQIGREKSLAVREQSALLDESRHQNRELAELNENLEKIVEERTLHIEKSKLEAEGKLSKMRRLIKLIKEMSAVDSLEGLMRKMRRELKRYHGLGEPSLVFSTGEIQKRIISFRGGKFTTQSLKTQPPLLSDTRVSHAEDQSFLANNLSRPVTRLIAIPLKLIGSPVYGDSVIYIEHDLNEKEVHSFLDQFLQVVQPLSLVLDRLLLEYRLRRSSYQWENTFDSLPNPIAIINDQHQTVRGNHLFDPENHHSHCHKLFAGFQEPCVGCPIGSVLQNGRPKIAQVNVEGKIFQVHSYPIRLSHSLKISHVVNYYVDITHSRELYGQVIQNEKMVAVGLLAGNIAHELNNPLTGIRSLSQVLMSSLDGQIKEDLLEVEKAASRSQRIIKNLLEFSETENEKWEVVTVDSVVEKTIPMLKTAMRIHRSNVDLNTREHSVLVEPHLLQQVVFNIVNNACQAMIDPGEISISSEVKGNEVLLQIADTGGGIPEHIQSQIFEPFFTTKDEGQGTGLGLSMSKSIVEKFAGTIWFESKPGEGTTFFIRLPISEESSEVSDH